MIINREYNGQSFIDNGFEQPEFDGTIHFSDGLDYFGLAEGKAVFWNEHGSAFQICIKDNNWIYLKEYNLKPIKKEWYENKNNFPCLIISKTSSIVHIAKGITKGIDNKLAFKISCDMHTASFEDWIVINNDDLDILKVKYEN